MAIGLAVDVVLFTVEERRLKLLLIERRNPPFQGSWALPGGFVELGEGLTAAAQRELAEETGIRQLGLEQLHTFGDNPKRDPRQQNVAVVYLGLTPVSNLELAAGDDAARAALHAVDKLPKLAFDHAEIICFAREELQDRCWSTHGAWKTLQRLLPTTFTLRDMQDVYEAIIGREVDKRNFRRKAHRSGYLLPTDRWVKGLRHRPAQLFRLATGRKK